MSRCSAAARSSDRRRRIFLKSPVTFLSIFAWPVTRATSARTSSSVGFARARRGLASGVAEPCPQTRQGSPGVRAWHKAQTSSLFLVVPPRALASPGAMPRIEAMWPTADLTLPIESRSS